MVCPLQILENNLGRILTPDNTVGGCHHAYWQVESKHLFDFSCHKWAEWGEDICVVPLALLHQFGLIYFVIEQMLITIVLTEGIVRKQHCVLSHVGHHAVGPVQHRCFNEHQLLAITDVETVACFDWMEVPFRMMMVSRD